ncbi:hypothetical protein F7P69_01375 [Cellulosimicrobium funkei]|nr:hypothetical protein [Cellulosimicrobium funkei]
MKRTPIAALTLATAALALTGCGGVEKDATYESVSDLREAVVAAEVTCPGNSPREDDSTPEQEYEYLKCGDGLELTVLTGEDKEGARSVIILGSMISGFNYLEGPNWVIFSQDASSLVTLNEALGGEVVIND